MDNHAFEELMLKIDRIYTRARYHRRKLHIKQLAAKLSRVETFADRAYDIAECAEMPTPENRRWMFSQAMGWDNRAGAERPWELGRKDYLVTPCDDAGLTNVPRISLCLNWEHYGKPGVNNCVVFWFRNRAEWKYAHRMARRLTQGRHNRSEALDEINKDMRFDGVDTRHRRSERHVLTAAYVPSRFRALGDDADVILMGSGAQPAPQQPAPRLLLTDRQEAA